MTPTQTLTERLQTVYEIAADMATIHNLPALAELVLLRIQSDLRFQEASLYTCDGNHLTFQAGAAFNTDGTRYFGSAQDARDHGREAEDIKLGEHITGWAALHGQPLLVPDVSKDNRYLGDSSPGRRHNQSELALPLMIGDRVIGLLNIEDDLINAFTPDDQKVLGLLAEQLTAAFENIRLHEKKPMKIVCSDRRGIYGYGIRQWGRGGGSGQSIIRSDSPVDHRCGQQVNGRQLKEQFAQLHPETSILYISGYTDDILAQYDLDQGTPFLEKPFTTETIIKQVNEILHRS